MMFTSACGGNQATGGNQGDSKEYTQGVSDDEILIGTLGPQSGPLAVYDLVRKGMESYFKYVNENGGVHGRNLKLIAYDDQYQPSRTVQLAPRLIDEDKVFLLAGNICTPCTVAASKIYKEKGIPVVMPVSGANQFVEPPIKNFFGSAFVNYRVEGRILLDYVVNKIGAKKIAVVYQNDDYGKEGLTAVREAIRNYDAEIVQEISYVAKDTDLSSQAQKIKQLNPDAILAFPAPAASANLKKELYNIGVTNIPFVVSAPGANDTNQFKLAGKEVWEGTISSAAFPMADLSDDPEMKLYLKRFSADYPKDALNGYAQMGWAIGQVTVEALKRTGPELTWENFYKTMHTFDNWDGSIFERVTFTPENHYGVTDLFITQAKDGQIVPITGKINFDPSTKKITYSK